MGLMGWVGWMFAVINVEDSNIVAVVHSPINVREQAQVQGQLRFDGSDGFGGLGNIVAGVHSLINVREQAQVRGQLRFDGSDGLGGLGVCCDKRRGQ
jgi:hypothetical protein